VGASGWEYYVPYQEDLGAALDLLRRQAFEEGDYLWDPWDHDLSAGQGAPRPRTIDELWADECVQELGTHSILDMDRVIGPRERPDYYTVQPVSAEEARRHAGTDRLTRAHVDAINPLAERRWLGRCAVLHDDEGRPQEIYFWGFSGD
jgi:hypothetical protein